MTVIAAIEAGGTKFICGLGKENGEVIERISIPTTTPDETMRKVIEYFSDKEFDGTGIGAGAVVNGRMVQGLTHPEMGHIFIKRHKDDKFEGRCPFHKDCLEGMAAGPAIEARWNKKGIELADRTEVWEMEAYYLAQALVNYILILSPQKIIMGGGVMKQKQMFPFIRKYVQEFLNGYVQKDAILKDIDNYIVYPGLGDEAGFVGSIALGKIALVQK